MNIIIKSLDLSETIKINNVEYIRKDAVMVNNTIVPTTNTQPVLVDILNERIDTGGRVFSVLDESGDIVQHIIY